MPREKNRKNYFVFNRGVVLAVENIFFLRSYHEFFEYFFREIGFLTHTTLLKIFSSRIGDFGLSFSSSLLQ